MRTILIVGIVAFVLIEAAAFTLAAQAIGILPTLGLGLASAVAGAVLLRRQGVAALTRMRAEAAAGRVPAAALLDGAAVAVAALLMILPGLVTDAIGLILFVPAVRGWLGRRLRTRLATHLAAERRSAEPAHATVVDLEPGQYAPRPRRESPWRGPA